MATWFNSTSIIVDDSDPSISYSPNLAWYHATGLDPQENDYNNTLSTCEEPGFTATFSFTGTGVEVYGTLLRQAFYGTDSSYSIDGGPPTGFAAAEVTTDTPRTLYFNSPPLDDGPHTLLIETTGPGDQFVYSLDYIIYTPGSTDAINKRALPVHSERGVILDGGYRWSKDTMTGGFLGGALCVFIAFLLLFHIIRRRRDKSAMLA